jgi:glycosyltransferase involved in cell wall biosynthesis
VFHQGRTGQTRALNRALRLATGEILARIDADDVALPERFARHVAFLDGHPDIGLLGTGCHEISRSGEGVGIKTMPADDAAIRRALIRENPFVHSSVMFRRHVLEAAGEYDERFAVAQDYDLWLRMSRVTRMANLPDPLVRRRLTSDSLSSARDTIRLWDEVSARLGALRRRTYPLWCAVFLAKPLCALALPPPARRLLRTALAARATGGGR